MLQNYKFHEALQAADSYKHDSQSQRHDGNCSFATAGEPRVRHPWYIQYLTKVMAEALAPLRLEHGWQTCGSPAVAKLQFPSCL